MGTSTHLNFVETLTENQLAREFLKKEYGLELLLRIGRYQPVVGLGGLYESLKSPKPTYDSFLTHLQKMRKKGSILIEPDPDQRNRKLISLPAELTFLLKSSEQRKIKFYRSAYVSQSTK